VVERVGQAINLTIQLETTTDNAILQLFL
jgi:hypothetical protein